jgi:hypothetical protein
MLVHTQGWSQDLITGLLKHEEIHREIESFLQVITEKSASGRSEL